MSTTDTTRTLTGRTVRDRHGEALGELERVYRSREDHQATWGVVGKGRFVPLSDAALRADEVWINADTDEVEEAPRFDPRDEVSPQVEERLRGHYGAPGGGTASPNGSGDASGGIGGGVATADRSTRRGVATEVRDRQREEFGGFSWGADFFGWLVAAGVATLLTAVLSAAGAAIGLTQVSGSEAEQSAGTISIVGGALLLVVFLLAYFAGGYVAGRLARFDGARQGVGAWLIGLAVTLLLAGAGAVFGSKYNVLEKLELPRLPVDEGSLATGGAIALVAILVGTLLAALLGGKAGERFHRKVDRVGYGL